MSSEQTELSILEQKNAHLSAALTQVRQELVRLREQLKHVNQPPLTLGVFIGGTQIREASRSMFLGD